MNILKYYGLKQKMNREKALYFYARKRAKILSLLPGKRKEFWKDNYKMVFEDEYHFRSDDNSIPQDHFFALYSIIVSDLIRREDIKQLQNGVRHLLMKRRSNRFIIARIDGLDEICKKINQMDASLLSWYNTVDCGVFELKNHPLEKSIDYFTLKIRNVNSGYLALEFQIHLKKIEKLTELIECNYNDRKGYIFSTLTGKSKETGAFKNYTAVHYNNENLKADKIYEILSFIEWEFMEALGSIFPFVFHKKGIMPPRIETYSTDIDYHEDNKSFWNSIGVNDYQGQFIDDRHKVFFENRLTERYGTLNPNSRIIYIFKDDDIEMGHLKSIKDEVYYHLREYAGEYFKFLFLDILSVETGKTLVMYKHKLDKIKLKKNHLNALLKLKYKLSLEIDDYSRYKRDDIWEKAKDELSQIYEDSDKAAKNATKSFFVSHLHFCDRAISNSMKIDNDVDIVFDEFKEKKEILQNLADYKNTVHSIRLNIVMMVISAVTLYFVIFPGKAEELAIGMMRLYDFWSQEISTLWSLIFS